VRLFLPSVNGLELTRRHSGYTGRDLLRKRSPTM
jgi:hypothetical protein